jgi:ankyrin repeat protein
MDEMAKPTLRGPEMDELWSRLKSLRRPERRQRPAVTLTDAASRGDVEAVRAFLAGGADVNEQTAGFASPLAAAAGGGHLEAVELLLEAGGAADLPGASVTPITSAAQHGRAAVVRRLLEAGVPAERSGSAMLAACAQGHLEVVRLLVEAGVDPHEPPEHGGGPLGNTPLEVAETMGQFHVAAFLRGEPAEDAVAEAPPSLEELFAEMQALEDSMDPDAQIEPLEGAEREAEQRELCALVRSEALAGRLDAPDPHSGKPPVVFAAENGLQELVRALLEAGAKPDTPDAETRLTALMAAAGAGEREIVRALLDGGADPNATSDAGYTALVRAAEWGDPETVRLLLASGADPRAATAAGETALTNARGVHAEEIRQTLREAAGTGAPGKPGEGVRFVRKKKMIDVKSARGSRDFVAHMSQGQMEWAVVAVRAPLGATGEAYAALHGAAALERDVAARSLPSAGSSVFAFQLRGQDWTLVPLALSGLRREDIQRAEDSARELSARLDTRAFAFTAEDSSGVLGYTLYERGEPLEHLEWEPDGEVVAFESRLREGPDEQRDHADPVFAAAGLYLPACELEDDGFELRLVLRGLRSEDLARADLVVLLR